jgi:hypothetical protein
VIATTLDRISLEYPIEGNSNLTLSIGRASKEYRQGLSKSQNLMATMVQLEKLRLSFQVRFIVIDFVKTRYSILARAIKILSHVIDYLSVLAEVCWF